jgi:DNA-binding beta-propeller fold protein YncE
LGGFLALTGSAILLLIALVRLLPSTTAQPAALPAKHVSQPTPLPTALTVTAGTTVVTARVLGAGIGLLAPQEAVEISGGDIAVADTGHGRLAILDAAGHLARSITAGGGPLEQPYAVVAGKRSLYLLDDKRGAIEQFDRSGHFQREIVHGAALIDAKGMALDRGGNLYVANPRSNSVIVVSPQGKIMRELSSALGSAPDQLNQPSDVGISGDGTVYVLDNVNNRIKEIRPSGAFVRSWPVPPSSTLYSVHVLPLRNGRILATDPAGSLLLYSSRGGAAQRLRLQIRGQAASDVSPLGLSLLVQGKVLVTDHAGNRLLVVTLPAR